MNKVVVSLLLGFTIGVLTASLVLAKEPDQSQMENEWCFRQQFDSQEHFDSFRKQDVGEEFDFVFIKMNGSKLQVHTRCVDTPLPHHYSPYN